MEKVNKYLAQVKVLRSLELSEFNRLTAHK